ncbi:unnamed protein product, partial [Rotaria socialis]
RAIEDLRHQYQKSSIIGMESTSSEEKQQTNTKDIHPIIHVGAPSSRNRGLSIGRLRIFDDSIDWDVITEGNHGTVYKMKHGQSETLMAVTIIDNIYYND